MIAVAHSGLRGPARVLVVARPELCAFIRLALSHGLYAVETISSIVDGEERK